MNLIVLFKSDFINNKQVLLNDRRFRHIVDIHRAKVGDTLTVGELNGKVGTGVIDDISSNHITLSISLNKQPPPPLPLTLIIALPRPKMIKRILQTCATMGVKHIIFINSFRVEKSYWQTPLLSDSAIQEQLILGLEQGKDTLLPHVTLQKRFKPFVEDELPDMCNNTTALVAHPSSDSPCPPSSSSPTTLVIGPEGGFIPYEIDKLNQAGCQSFHLGTRILKVETVIPVLLGKLFH